MFAPPTVASTIVFTSPRVSAPSSTIECVDPSASVISKSAWLLSSETVKPKAAPLMESLLMVGSLAINTNLSSSPTLARIKTPCASNASLMSNIRSCVVTLSLTDAASSVTLTFSSAIPNFLTPIDNVPGVELPELVDVTPTLSAMPSRRLGNVVAASTVPPEPWRIRSTPNARLIPAVAWKIASAPPAKFKSAKPRSMASEKSRSID